jgi:hypothetical protein
MPTPRIPWSLGILGLERRIRLVNLLLRPLIGGRLSDIKTTVVRRLSPRSSMTPIPTICGMIRQLVELFQRGEETGTELHNRLG